MEKELKIEYVRIHKDNTKECTDFMCLGYEYMKETVPDKSLEIYNKFLNSIINKQTEEERWLIALKVDDRMVGFTHFKVDRSERIGWGYILEFYIVPDFRRKGLGIKLYNFIKEEFHKQGIENIWLTSDKINGEPFWFSIGFRDTGEVENELKVLEISI